MGTPFAAASREIGGELQLMGRMGYDAATFGNHETDLGPDGLGKAITVAAKAGHIPAVVASNFDFSKDDATLTDLKRLTREGLIRRHHVIERGGIRFGLFGVLGKEAQIYTSGGAVTFADPIETAKEMVKVLRETEKVDVIIALSHGGVTKGTDGRYTGGEDVELPRAVPGIDVVIGGHSHTELREAIIVNDRTPVVQTGKEGQNLGELVISLDGATLKVESYRLYPVDDTILGDRAIAGEIDILKKSVTGAVFASRGYSIDQPLAVAPRDLPNTFTDIGAGTLLANLVTDSFREATKADIGFTANGMMRAALKRGKSGVQTVYDVFAVAPLGSGVIDPTAGSSLVTGYFTGQELKHLLEFLLVDSPAHPGEYFPRTSGMRFRYDPSRPKFDVVTAIEIGDSRSRLPTDRHHREGRAPVQPHLPHDARHDRRGHPEVHQGQAAPRPQEQGGPAPQVEGRGTRRPPRQHPRPAVACGYGGQGQCRHGGRQRRRPRDQGMAGDHGSPPQPAGQDQGRTAGDPGRRTRRRGPGDQGELSS